MTTAKEVQDAIALVEKHDGESSPLPAALRTLAARIEAIFLQAVHVRDADASFARELDTRIDLLEKAVASPEGAAIRSASSAALADDIRAVAVSDGGGRTTRECFRMIRALCADQKRMHQVNGDGLDVQTRLEAIERECLIGEGIAPAMPDPEKVAASILEDLWPAQSDHFDRAGFTAAVRRALERCKK